MYGQKYLGFLFAFISWKIWGNDMIQLIGRSGDAEIKLKNAISMHKSFVDNTGGLYPRYVVRFHKEAFASSYDKIIDIPPSNLKFTYRVKLMVAEGATSSPEIKLHVRDSNYNEILSSNPVKGDPGEVLTLNLSGIINYSNYGYLDFDYTEDGYIYDKNVRHTLEITAVPIN